MEANHRSEIEMTNNKGANSNVNNINDPTVHNAQLLGKSQLSSLPLQMLIYLSYHYSPLFFFVNLCLFTFKGKKWRQCFLINANSDFVAVRYYYPSQFLGWELTTIFLFIFIEMSRLSICKLF
jgi:hypothetical protein